tara:strand:- start:2 stop:487 length:486 start_codon:yes stop_codon:yes gene_type:complete
MNEIIIFIILFFVGLVVGFFATLFVNRSRYKNQSIQILKDAKKAAEQIKTDKILQAKEKFIELKSAHEKVILKRNKDLELKENKVRQKEQNLNARFEEYNRKNQKLKQDVDDFEKRKSALQRKENEIDENHRKQVDLLQNISGMTKVASFIIKSSYYINNT